ncbi:alcohol oxidase [Mycena floridula]|nr:alcohol oxidase [Mycena floridula]
MYSQIVLALASAVLGLAALENCSSNTTSQSLYDFIVVGSGAGGGPLAARLAENGYSVLLMEAGSRVDSFNTTIPAYFARGTEDKNIQLAYNVTEFSTQNSRVSWYPRGGALGGSTIINAMINIIGDTEPDFDGIATISNDESWSRKNMQAYYQKIERNRDVLPLPIIGSDHGFTGWLTTTVLPYFNLLHNLAILDLQLISVFTSLTPSQGLSFLTGDLNSYAQDAATGVFLPSFTIDENHKRASVYNRLVDVDSKSNSKLTIMNNALVTRLLLCEGSEGVTAYGVEYAPGGKLAAAGNFDGKKDLNVQTVTARHEIIVSAGVFQSPQLLMLSGIGDPVQLSEFGIETVVPLPGVGKNFQDHDELSIIWRLKDDYKLFDGCTFLSDPDQDPCLKDYLASGGQNLYAFSGTLDAIVTKSQATLTAHDTLTYYAPAYFEGFAPGFSQKIADNPNVLTAIVLMAHPSSRGSVQLTGSHPQDPLSIQKRHFQAPGGQDDISALADGIEKARLLVENSLIAPFIVEEIFPGRDANVTQHVLDHVFGHHACCTNPIGPDDDPDAVLDSNFKVRGVGNLRVVDLSSWTNVPGYFVTTPTYMISEKAADIIVAAAKQRST